MSHVRDSEYLQLMARNKWGCRYRRLDHEWKRKFQAGFVEFQTLTNRPDSDSPLVQEILQLYLERAKIILTTPDRRVRLVKTKALDDQILAKKALLPEV